MGVYIQSVKSAYNFSYIRFSGSRSGVDMIKEHARRQFAFQARHSFHKIIAIDRILLCLP